jgi:hypothetical protein
VRRAAWSSCMRFLPLSIVELGCLRDPDVGGFSRNSLPPSRGLRLDRSCIVHCSAQGDVRQPGRHNTRRDPSRACVSPVALRPRLSPSLPLSRAFHLRSVRSCRAIVLCTSGRRAEMVRGYAASMSVTGVTSIDVRRVTIAREIKESQSLESIFLTVSIPIISSRAISSDRLGACTT